MRTNNQRTGQRRLDMNLDDRGESAPRQGRDARLMDDLTRPGAPPLTTRELAQMIGMSSTFIREEIRSGHLHAVLIGRGRKRVFRILVREARRYVKALGLM